MAQKRPAPPKRSEIVAYWLSDEGKDRAQFIWERIACDRHEPTCFKCGHHDAAWIEDDWRKAWDSAKGLERAHIIAHSADGPNDASNFVLLCVACHTEAPMTNRPDIMFEWIRRDRVSHERISAGLASVGASLDDIRILAEIGPKRALDLYKAAHEKLECGNHFGQFRFSAATTAVAMLEAARMAKDLGLATPARDSMISLAAWCDQPDSAAQQ